MFTARVPGDLSYRELVGDVVRAVCKHVERRERCAGLEWRVVSAFNEAFNNVAEHAYDEATRGDVVIAMRVEANRLVLELSDQGRGFEFDAGSGRVAPTFEELDDGGMGLFIMRRSMTDVTYERGATNRLTLVQDLAECREGLDAATAPGTTNDDEGSQC